MPCILKNNCSNININSTNCNTDNRRKLQQSHYVILFHLRNSLLVSTPLWTISIPFSTLVSQLYITVRCAGESLVVWEVHTGHEATDGDYFFWAELFHHLLTQAFHNQPDNEPRTVYTTNL